MKSTLPISGPYFLFSLANSDGARAAMVMARRRRGPSLSLAKVYYVLASGQTPHNTHILVESLKSGGLPTTSTLAAAKQSNCCGKWYRPRMCGWVRRLGVGWLHELRNQHWWRYVSHFYVFVSYRQHVSQNPHQYLTVDASCWFEVESHESLTHVYDIHASWVSFPRLLLIGECNIVSQHSARGAARGRISFGKPHKNWTR